jgi:hypothetical protein
MPAELTLAAGPGGWVEAHLLEAGPTSPCWVRLMRDGDLWHEWARFELLTGTAARSPIPVHRIVIAVNASEGLKDRLAERLEEDVPELGTADFLKAFDGFLTPEPRFVLKRPAERRLDDDFYRTVARAYREAAARGMNPRTTIAEDACVSAEVAGRWIYEARKPSRGFLPATAPGKVSA